MEIAKARPPYVVFEIRPEEDREATIASGIETFKDVHYAIITPQGSKDRIERRVDEWFENLKQQVRQERFSEEWLNSYKTRYAAWKEGQVLPEHGHSVTNWAAIGPAQVKQLQAAGIRTIEDLANANEETISRLAMGGRSLKQRAVEWLSSATTGSSSERLAALHTENENLKVRVESLTNQLTEVLAHLKRLSPSAKAPEAQTDDNDPPFLTKL